MSMNIDTASYSFSGGHKVNEDSVYSGTGIYAVADGLGGHFGGELASAEAVRYISQNYKGDMSDKGIDDLLEGANSAVAALHNDSHTTIAAVFIGDGTLRYANVGDSRVYVFRNNKVMSVSRDHSVCRVAVDMGEMSFEDIRFSDDRSRLLKVLGNDEKLDLRTQYQPVRLADGDAFLICSDGFWENVHEREMEADLLKADSATTWARLMLKRQLLRAQDKGDNYSVICGIVHFEGKSEFPATTVPEHCSEEIPATQAISVEPKRKKSAEKAVIAILAAACVLSAGAAVYFALRNNVSSPEVSYATETSEDITHETSGSVVASTEETGSEVTLNATLEEQVTSEVSQETETAEVVPDSSEPEPVPTEEHENTVEAVAVTSEPVPPETTAVPPAQTEELVTGSMILSSGS